MRTDLLHRSPPAAPPPRPVAPPVKFNDKVMASAEENCAKLLERKRKREVEPKLLVQAIRESYATSPLVLKLQEILSVLSDENFTPMGFGIAGPTRLVLTAEGFRVRTSHDLTERTVLHVSPLCDTLNVGEDGTCAEARAFIDKELEELAKSPEKFAMPIEDKLPEHKPQARPNRFRRQKPKSKLSRVPLLGKLFR